MGCVLSGIDEDGRVGICKERKKVIKQLVGIREEFSDSILAYLRALRNTGGTLRQFTESDTLELEIASNGLAEPPSPPTNLLPPPLPPFLADKSTDEIIESLEEENWKETKTEFEEEGTDSEAAESVEKSAGFLSCLQVLFNSSLILLYMARFSCFPSICTHPSFPSCFPML